jgi:hypothetical protein
VKKVTVAKLRAEIRRLESENARLRERLDASPRSVIGKDDEESE